MPLPPPVPVPAHIAAIVDGTGTVRPNALAAHVAAAVDRDDEALPPDDIYDVWYGMVLLAPRNNHLRALLKNRGPQCELCPPGQ